MCGVLVQARYELVAPELPQPFTRNNVHGGPPAGKRHDVSHPVHQMVQDPRTETRVRHPTENRTVSYTSRYKVAWRRIRDSNPCRRLCRSLPSHSVNPPRCPGYPSFTGALQQYECAQPRGACCAVPWVGTAVPWCKRTRRFSHQTFKVPPAGIEPATDRVENGDSSAELRRQNLEARSLFRGMDPRGARLPAPPRFWKRAGRHTGHGDGTPIPRGGRLCGRRESRTPTRLDTPNRFQTGGHRPLACPSKALTHYPSTGRCPY